MLYDRDYRILTEEEIIDLDKAEKYLKNKKAKKSGLTINMLSKYHEMRPEASYYYKSLFPNNFLSTKTLIDKKELKQIGKEFEILLDSNPTERQILNFINQNKHYNLIKEMHFTISQSLPNHNARQLHEVLVQFCSPLIKPSLLQRYILQHLKFHVHLSVGREF